MKAEEQLFSLMAIADEQQRLITQSIEQQAASMQTQIRQQQAFLTELQAAQQEVQRTFESNVAELNRKLSRQVSGSRLFLTVVMALLFAGAIATGLTVYARDIQAELKESRAALRVLERYNADIRTCPKDGKDFPCVRVMRSWGGYGEFEDYFILDPK